jgi:hypothetical protein
MRRLSIFFVSACVLSIASAVLALAAQSQTFTSDNVDYTLELPSTAWRIVQEADSIHQHTEFIYGDRTEGYLRIRKEVVDEGTTASDLARRDREQKLRFIPGYVEGKEERFAGRLNGVTISYEFTNGGKPMAGRTYYLQADNRTVYALRFTALRDKLSRIRNQTDLIARSFQTKQ